MPAFSVFALLGVFSAWLALSSLIPSVRAIVSHAPLVVLSPHDAIGLPLALLSFALAGMTLAPRLTSDRDGYQRRKAEGCQASGLTVCLGVAVASVLLTVVIVPVAEVTASAVMADRHYVRCPTPLHERRAPMRWVSAQGRCP